MRFISGKQLAQAEELVESRTGGFELEMHFSKLTLLPVRRADVLQNIMWRKIVNE
jgi:hypothetical protein